MTGWECYKYSVADSEETNAIYGSMWENMSCLEPLKQMSACSFI